MKNIAIFASGSGTNAENIANYDGGLNASGKLYIYDQYNQNYNISRTAKSMH